MDEVKVANFVSMLLTKHASIWLRSQTIDWSTIKYSELKSEMYKYFRPADHECKARDELHRCIQQNTMSVTGYITAFRRAAQRVANLSPDECLDKFLRGLKPQLLERVL